ncbi:hypothetical protein BSKO_13171 [Bryopsis sp. KO-2023]|nr:hypothetical protein BSKO_13171 [Bryopsis sp. KO-2023]
MKAALIFIVCVASSMLANAVPVPVVGRSVIIPFPASKCTATNLQSGQTPLVDCEAANVLSTENQLGAGTALELPTGQFGRCEFTVDDEGEIQTSCVGIPLIFEREPKIENGVLTLPTTAKSCVLTNIHDCPNGVVLVPEVECTDAGPGESSFREGETFDFSGGNFGRCTIGADADGAALVQCVGVPVSAFPPVSVGSDGSITLPEGATSCEATYEDRNQPPLILCKPPVFGCKQPVFRAGLVVFGLRRGAASVKCTYEARPDGSARGPSCSILRNGF